MNNLILIILSTVTLIGQAYAQDYDQIANEAIKKSHKNAKAIAKGLIHSDMAMLMGRVFDGIEYVNTSKRTLDQVIAKTEDLKNKSRVLSNKIADNTSVTREDLSEYLTSLQSLVRERRHVVDDALVVSRSINQLTRQLEVTKIEAGDMCRSGRSLDRPNFGRVDLRSDLPFEIIGTIGYCEGCQSGSSGTKMETNNSMSPYIAGIGAIGAALFATGAGPFMALGAGLMALSAGLAEHEMVELSNKQERAELKIYEQQAHHGDVIKYYKEQCADISTSVVEYSDLGLKILSHQEVIESYENTLEEKREEIDDFNSKQESFLRARRDIELLDQHAKGDCPINFTCEIRTNDETETLILTRQKEGETVPSHEISLDPEVYEAYKKTVSDFSTAFSIEDIQEYERLKFAQRFIAFSKDTAPTVEQLQLSAIDSHIQNATEFFISLVIEYREAQGVIGELPVPTIESNASLISSYQEFVAKSLMYVWGEIGVVELNMTLNIFRAEVAASNMKAQMDNQIVQNLENSVERVIEIIGGL